jgi:hypothetical protein
LDGRCDDFLKRRCDHLDGRQFGNNLDSRRNFLGYRFRCGSRFRQGFERRRLNDFGRRRDHLFDGRRGLDRNGNFCDGRGNNLNGRRFRDCFKGRRFRNRGCHNFDGREDFRRRNSLDRNFRRGDNFDGRGCNLDGSNDFRCDDGVEDGVEDGRWRRNLDRDGSRCHDLFDRGRSDDLDRGG